MTTEQASYNYAYNRSGAPIKASKSTKEKCNIEECLVELSLKPFSLKVGGLINCKFKLCKRHHKELTEATNGTVSAGSDKKVALANIILDEELDKKKILLENMGKGLESRARELREKEKELTKLTMSIDDKTRKFEECKEKLKVLKVTVEEFHAYLEVKERIDKLDLKNKCRADNLLENLF